MFIEKCGAKIHISVEFQYICTQNRLFIQAMIKKIAIYFIFVLLFVVGKFCFMCFHYDIFGIYQVSDWFSALWHGLPHDLTCAGYIMALPFVAELIRIWCDGKWHSTFMRWYLRVMLLLVLINYFVDLIIYGAWGFRLDNTVLIYLFDNPVESLEQGSFVQWAGGLTALFLLTYLLQKPIVAFYSRPNERRIVTDLSKQEGGLKQRFIRMVVNVLLCGLLFVAIRGGVTASTMNIGRVYFCSEMPLNQAATNPLFSFIYSLSHKKNDFSKQYRFMSAEEAAAACEEMNRKTNASCTSEIVGDNLEALAVNPDTLLTTTRPNIVLLILESFSGAACRGVYADADPSIMPHVNQIYQDGIGFTNLFANSFRTDRGCASILASYPAQPTNSVMKDQARCNHLQYFSKRLQENGYDLSFVHGGDVNFTNMRGFLTAGGFTHIVGDSDFPISERLSKWGVPDHLMFDYLYNQVADASKPVDAEAQKPFLKVMLTLSSHEPFDVPYHHFDDPYLNSVAYTDSCIGSFIERLKQTPAWDNLLVIGVADHAYGRYPETIQNHEILRYRIPMFWTGGAVTYPRLIEVYGNQVDLAATLLHQMNIPCSDFNFSKDMADPSQPHYAFYSFSDGFGFITDSCRYIQDNVNDGSALSGSDDLNGTAERWGKAYLQTLYDDLQSR